jgi:hypothetical protein
MDAAGTPMLFVPPRPPVPLPGRGAVVLGRSRDCDVTLGSPDASRRHAEIVGVGGDYLVRDLASTNGTFVNGERIEERTLRGGDRIEIGGDLMTFCRVGRGLDTPDPGEAGEAQTVMAERPSLGECIRGDLAEIPPFAVIQMLEMGNKTGVLEAETEDGPGRLWLAHGRPVCAETKSLRGFDAAVAIVHATSGRFSFEPSRAAPERTIEATVTELLLEASRQLDERS